MTSERLFPFSAVVGQEQAKLALMLCAMDPRIGGVLLYGDKGSAKSTLARALATLMGPSAPFVELPLSATEDRVIGTLDVVAALKDGEVRFAEGLFAKAHGGVLYVDEVNLLPDHLVDVLLDVAASGVNRIEREGVSHEHPARFVLVGSMNPEEGELRPQLLDRFAFGVDISSSLSKVDRVQAIMTRLAFERGDEEALRWAREADEQLAARIASRRPLEVTEATATYAGAICASLGAQGLRADLSLCRGAAALAGLEGEGEVTKAHLVKVVTLVCAHRRLHPPGGSSSESLEEQVQSALSELEDQHGTTPPSSSDVGSPGAEQADGDLNEAQVSGESSTEVSGDDVESSVEPSQGPRLERAFSSGSTSPEQVRGSPLSKASSFASPSARQGRDRGVVEGRGRLIGDRPYADAGGDIAVAATLRTAARRRAFDPTDVRNDVVQEEDLRAAKRRDRAGRLVVVAVDASKSMHSERRIAETKSAVLSLLVDAYQRRDKVALVAFGGAAAQIALRPTSSPEVAKARLEAVQVGGLTPLGDGIRVACDLASAHPCSLVVLITDGRATASSRDSMSPIDEAMAEASALRRSGVESVVVDVEDERGALGLAKRLADVMGAHYQTMSMLSGEALARAVREILG